MGSTIHTFVVTIYVVYKFIKAFSHIVYLCGAKKKSVPGVKVASIEVHCTRFLPRYHHDFTPL